METTALAVRAAILALTGRIPDQKSVSSWKLSHLDVWIVVVAVTLEGFILSSTARAQSDLPSISQPTVSELPASSDFESINGMMTNDSQAVSAPQRAMLEVRNGVRLAVLPESNRVNLDPAMRTSGIESSRASRYSSARLQPSSGASQYFSAAGSQLVASPAKVRALEKALTQPSSKQATSLYGGSQGTMSMTPPESTSSRIPALGRPAPTGDLGARNVQRFVEQQTDVRSTNIQHLPVLQFAAANPLGGGEVRSGLGLRQRRGRQLKRMLAGYSSEKTSLITLAGSKYWLGWTSMDSQWQGWNEWNGWSEESSATNDAERGTAPNGSKGTGGFGVSQPSVHLENPERTGMPKIPTASGLVNAEESGADPTLPSQQ